MELFFSDLFTMPAFNWPNVGLCLMLIGMTFFLTSAGFPIAYSIAGSTIIFTLVAMVLGLVNIDILNSYPNEVYAILNSKVLVAVPLFIFMGILLERAKIAENPISKFKNHWQLKSEVLLFTVSLLDLLLLLLTAIVTSFFRPFSVISFPFMLNKEHLNSEMNEEGHKYNYNLNSSALNFLPLPVMLVLLSDQMINAQISALAIVNGETEIAKTNILLPTISEFFIGMIMPGVLLICLYSLYHTALILKYPNKFVASQSHKPSSLNKDSGSSSQPNSRNELVKSLASPLVYLATILGAIITMSSTIADVASIAVIGAALIVCQKLVPSKNQIYLNIVISFFSLIIFSRFIQFNLETIDINPWNIALLSISMFFTGYIIYGLWVIFSSLYDCEFNDSRSLLRDALLTTVLQTSKIFIFLTSAVIFVLVFKGIGGQNILIKFFELYPTGSVLPLLSCIALIVLAANVLSALQIILIVIPILLPPLIVNSMSGGQMINIVWLGVMLALIIQISALIPPFGHSIPFVKQGLSGGIKSSNLYLSILPYCITMSIIVLLIWVYPDLTTWPNFLLSN